MDRVTHLNAGSSARRSEGWRRHMTTHRDTRAAQAHTEASIRFHRGLISPPRDCVSIRDNSSSPTVPMGMNLTTQF